MPFTEPIFGSNLPYSQSPSLNDLARQLEYEVYFCPQGFVAEVLEAWYNSLYSETQTPGCVDDDYGVCPDAETDPVTIPDILIGLVEGDAVELIIRYMVQRMFQFADRNQAFDFANRMRDSVNAAINRYQNPPPS